MNNDKIQGEGDYEAARRFEKDEAEFVEEHTKDGKKIRGSAEDASGKPTAAEREGLSHAKSGDQDSKDAQRMRDKERKGD